jgi:hypothetical protein
MWRNNIVCVARVKYVKKMRGFGNVAVNPIEYGGVKLHLSRISCTMATQELDT